MADRETIARIAKILARATSPEPHEASAALHGAYKRMARDGVTFADLLSLPLDELYQDALVKLVDVILADQSDLSPSAKRAAYAEYMRQIVAKFSGSDTSKQESSREAEARQYEERRKREEAARGRSGEGSRHTQDNEKPPKQPDVNTAKQENAFTASFRNVEFSFSPATFFSVLLSAFGRGSVTWHMLNDPMRGFRFFAASFLWGCAFAGVVVLIAGLLHALLGVGPLIDFKLKSVFSFLAAIGTLWKGRVLYLDGWFR